MSKEEVKSILRTLLPKAMSRKMVLSEKLDRISTDVGRNCGRIRSALTIRIGKNIDYYSKQLKDLGSDLIAQIEQAVQKGLKKRRAGSESTVIQINSGKRIYTKFLSVPIFS